jgi:uncharacterized protein (TIGR03000 family)
MPKKGDGGAMLSAPATIVVSLPAEAKLIVDGKPTKAASARRYFISPALEQGQDYFYTLKAEFTRDGQTVSTSKRVTVRAGVESLVTFETPAASVAQR